MGKLMGRSTAVHFGQLSFAKLSFAHHILRTQASSLQLAIEAMGLVSAKV
ncbi:MAG: hypothetical protein IAA31_05760 [Candidatus Anaerobiospirillum merdipullorum]|uniref:Uncharacterized protein n=1 Tax=Candidatus Anaerobiospirillum merdipullorum TaxID=2838450 RepID=A0A9E2KPP1_9GAMM|nr:hypothetical protein [Candidatus Anaerobiospirillum merdipullorum]